MHLTGHVAIGATIALLSTLVIPGSVPFLGIAIAIAAGCVIDMDFVLLRFTRIKNHRMYLTHSVLVPLMLLLVSVLFFLFISPGTSLGWIALVSSINVLVHDAIDSTDWGLNFFANGKIVGKKLLLGGKDAKEFYEEAKKFVPYSTRFYLAYYGNTWFKLLEIIAASSMIGSFIITWPGAGHEQWWALVAYAFTFAFHAIEYRKCTRAKHVS
jgi:hypothetical protein